MDFARYQSSAVGGGNGPHANRQWWHFSMLVVGLALLSACDSSEKTDVRQTQQAVVEEHVILLPGTASLGAHALVAAGELNLADRVSVVDKEGLPAAVANAGAGTTMLGVQTAVGDILSRGPVELRNNAQVQGDVMTAGGINQQSGATVTGTETTFAAGLTPAIEERITMDFGGPSLGNVNQEPPNGSSEGVRVLAPGRYGRVTIKSNNRLELRSGTYNLDELSLEPQTRLLLDDAAGPVLINVRQNLQYKATVESTLGGHPALRIAYVGQNQVVLETTFRGALLAPHASVRLATNHPTLRHVGVFFAKNLEVSPDVTVEFRPYWSYEVEPEYTASGAPGRLGTAAVMNTGEVLVDSYSNLVRLTTTGLMSNEFDTDARRRIVIGTGATGFGYHEGDVFRRFRPDGTLIADLPAGPPGVAKLIPGTEGTIVAYGADEHKADHFAGIRIHVGGSAIDVADAGMLDLAVGPEQVVYTKNGETIAVDLSGSELWRKDLQLLNFTISEASNQLIGAYNDGGPRVVHIHLPDGDMSDVFTPTSAPWTVEISPNGERSLVATKERVATFSQGELVRDFALPFGVFATADVLDSGEMVIGGADAGQQTYLFVVGPEIGTGQWLSPPGEADVGAFRPFVAFAPDSLDFVSVQKAGLTRYNVERSL